MRVVIFVYNVFVPPSAPSVNPDPSILAFGPRLWFPSPVELFLMVNPKKFWTNTSRECQIKPSPVIKKKIFFFLSFVVWVTYSNSKRFFFFKISSVRLLLHMFVESTQWSHGAAETMEMLRAATVSFRCLIKIYCMMENCWLSLKIRGFCFTVVKDKNGSVVI